jgi:hypothetical protein
MPLSIRRLVHELVTASRALYEMQKHRGKINVRGFLSYFRVHKADGDLGGGAQIPAGILVSLRTEHGQPFQ